MTKRYKALKDLIGMKAGDVLEPGNGYGDLYRIQDLTAGAMIVIPKDHIQTALEGGWIEEAGQVDNWPQYGDQYSSLTANGEEISSIWQNDECDQIRQALGNVFHTEEEAETHVRYLKALTRVKGSSSWVPDWDDRYTVKYHVLYNHNENELQPDPCNWMTHQPIGIPVWFPSIKAAEQAIKDHKEDFLILAGVK